VTPWVVIDLTILKRLNAHAEKRLRAQSAPPRSQRIELATRAFCILIYAYPTFPSVFFGSGWAWGNRKWARFAGKTRFLRRKSLPKPPEKGPARVVFLPPNERFQSLTADFPSGLWGDAGNRPGQRAANLDKASGGVALPAPEA
jgi:hypothetical protein